MKTNFRNIIAVSALAFAGVLSVNAAENSSTLVGSTENTAETIDYRKEAQLITHWIADRTEAKVTRKVMEKGFVSPAEASGSFGSEAENAIEMADFRKEAQLMTKAIADKEEAEATQKVMEKAWATPTGAINSFEDEPNYGLVDFRLEAQLMTRLIADKEEMKAVRKLVAEGKIAENN